MYGRTTKLTERKKKCVGIRKVKKKNNNVRKEKMYLGGLVALMHPKMAEGRPIGRLTTDNKELRSFLHSILLFEKKLITMDSGAQCASLFG